MGETGINTQTIANLATAASGLFIAYQAWVAKKAYKVSNERAEKEKAIELAEIYAKEILTESSYITLILREIGVVDLLKNIKAKDLVLFDQHELDDLLDKDTQKKIKQLLEDVDFKTLQKYRNMYKNISFDEFLSHRTMILSENIFQFEQYLNEASATSDDCQKNDELKSKIKSIKKTLKSGNIPVKSEYYEQIYTRDFFESIDNLLNTLEYFCMYFNTGVADESVVYQSLHQTFLGNIKLLYFEIASRNTNGRDKYYTNIIELYNKWNKRDRAQQKKDIHSSRTNTFKSEKIKK